MNIWDDLEDVDLEPLGYAAMVWNDGGWKGLTFDGDLSYVDTEEAMRFQAEWMAKAVAGKLPVQNLKEGEYEGPKVVEVDHDNSLEKATPDGIEHEDVLEPGSAIADAVSKWMGYGDDEDDEDDLEDTEGEGEFPEPVSAPVFTDPDATPWWVHNADEEIDDKTGEGRAGKAEITVSWQGTQPRLTQRFSNVVQLVDFLKMECKYPDAQRYSRSASRKANSLGLDWPATEKMLVTGWEDGVEKIAAIEAKLKSLLAGALPEVKQLYDVKGVSLDMGKLVSGEPEVFLNDMEMEEDMTKKKGGKIIHIITTFDIAYGDAFIQRGAAICALANILQRYDNNKVVVDAHIGSNDLVDTWIRVKESSWPVNYSDMAFFTAHPAMFWRVAYACWELMPEDIHNRSQKLGIQSMGWISEPPKGQRGDVYVSALASAWCATEKSMLKWLCEQLVANGIDVDMTKVEL